MDGWMYYEPTSGEKADLEISGAEWRCHGFTALCHCRASIEDNLSRLFLTSRNNETAASMKAFFFLLSSLCLGVLLCNNEVLPRKDTSVAALNFSSQLWEKGLLSGQLGFDFLHLFFLSSLIRRRTDEPLTMILRYNWHGSSFFSSLTQFYVLPLVE